ncbi:MAG: MurR/RpiR family transcriptional regulator [Desulfobacterales bacterium]|nr:MurR/RpiR family transcriptional regulator [Desulfobacterales bacterium]
MTTTDFLFTGIPRPQLTAAQGKILDYLMSHLDDVAYMSSAELAERLGISNATVVRFSQHIGYKGYLDLQRHIRQEIKTRLKVPERVKKTPPNIRSPKDFLNSVLKSDRENLDHMRKTISEDLFEAAVREIHSRKEVWVLGLRSCHGAAHYFSTNLRFLSRRVNLISLDAGTVWSQIQPGLNPESLLISITFPRYCTHTLDITDQFYKAGAKIISITDSQTSPLAAMGSYVFPLPFWIDSFFESATAVTSFLNAILASVSFMDGRKTMDGLQALEQVWEEKNVYSNQTQTVLPTWANRLKKEQKK